MSSYDKNNKHIQKPEYEDYYNYNRKQKFEDISSSSGGKMRKRKRNKKKAILSTFVLILSVIFAIAGSALLYLYKTLDSMNFAHLDETSSSETGDSSSEKSSENLLNDSMVLNVLIFGSDSRTSSAEDGRSDSMLMMSIDNRNKKTKLTSFLRDTWVQIPGYGNAKLNAAFAYGGPKLAVETVEKNFGIEVDRYIVVDFQSFSSIVDTLGGVDIELTADEVQFINYAVKVEDLGNASPISGAGMHHLNGVQALAHSRNRNSALSDFDRTTRQRDVVSAILNELRTASLPQLTSVVSKIGPMITTDLKKNEITSLLSNSPTYLNYEMIERGAPKRDECYDTYSDDGQAILIPNSWKELRHAVASYIYEDSFAGSSKSSSN